MNVFTAPQGPLELHGLRFEIAAMSEQGPRSENQDAFAIDEFARTGLLAVADGMGGERSGRVAADTALRALAEDGPIRSLDDARRAVRRSDAEVARSATDNPDAHGGMGCALALMALAAPRGDGAGWIAAHVGDVRILSRAPDGTVRLETRDHTPAFARWEAGEISLDEIPDTSGANRLQRAIGRGGEADVGWLPARPGWSWLIISDGVYKVMRLDELGELMGTTDTSAACDAIRRKVEERGPEDNFTAVLVRALGGPAMRPTTHDQTEPMIRPTPAVPAAAPNPGRRGGSAAALILALLALALAGYAAWIAMQLRGTTAGAAELERLRLEVDSLAAQVQQVAEPFGPVDSALPADSAAARLLPELRQ
jgi:serine/threonine protein phosphatase PrpC